MRNLTLVVGIVIWSAIFTVAQDFSTWQEITASNINQIEQLYSLSIDIPVSDPVMILLAGLVDFDEANKLALIRYSKNQAVMWDMATQTNLYEISTPNATNIPNSKYVVTVDYDKGITQITSKRTNEVLANLQGVNLIFSHDNTLLAITDYRSLKIIETESWSTLFTLIYPSINSMNFCPDNSCIVVSDFNGQGRVDYWDLTVAEPIKQELVYRADKKVDAVVGTYLPFTQDGAFLLIQESTKLYVWDIVRQQLHNTKDADNLLPLEQQYVTVYPYQDGENIRFFDIASGDDFAQIPNRIVAINPNATIVIACDISCQAIDLISGEILADALPFDGFRTIFGKNYLTDIDDKGQLVVFGIKGD